MALKWPDKDPDANKDYSVDWSAALATAETIEVSVWTASSPDLAIGLDDIKDAVCTVWLSGGVAGASYTVKNTITTHRGMIDERTVTIKVKEQ